jgi:hypothetical protein
MIRDEKLVCFTSVASQPWPILNFCCSLAL